MGSRQLYLIKGTELRVQSSIVKYWCVHKWHHLLQRQIIALWVRRKQFLIGRSRVLMSYCPNMPTGQWCWWETSQFLMSSHLLSLMAFSAFSILPGKLCLENHFPLPFPSPSSSFLLCLLGYFLLVFLLARRYPLGQVTEIEYFPPI